MGAWAAAGLDEQGAGTPPTGPAGAPAMDAPICTPRRPDHGAARLAPSA
jgi:hypothetical protein